MREESAGMQEYAVVTAMGRSESEQQVLQHISQPKGCTVSFESKDVL